MKEIFPLYHETYSYGIHTSVVRPDIFGGFGKNSICSIYKDGSPLFSLGISKEICPK
jgi:hypothetical protein